MKRKPVDICVVCSKPTLLHFDARGRKLDCSRVPTKAAALAHAYARIQHYTAYIARLSRELKGVA